MQRKVLAFSAAVALVALTGCPPPYPKCSSDEACKEHNEVCVQGQCQECAQDSNCKPGFVCQENKCIPKPACTSDSACPSGQHCQAGHCTEASATKTCTKKSDCQGGEDCQDGVCTPASEGEKCNWSAVHFGFNDAALTPDAQSQLGGLASCIKEMKGKVRLEGNADERGTEEYNLQLSNRRAASVKKYLMDLGVPSSRLETVGYGANRPVASGHTEEAWAANRRVELKH
jgi:peptidoglycan-associated lipoprotein